ncbi:MAG TPA: glutamate synthase [Firmicutes bacterium]|nr:glutamate synthase [Bacillota bacterium]
MTIDARGRDFAALNEAIRAAGGFCEVRGCVGQRFIAAGMSGCDIKIFGVPGNALGAYLNGGTIEVFGNAQDAVGDTMNSGSIIVHGSIGDTAGYAMRGGEIYVRGNAGYRAGIHMKAYQDKLPVMVIGGCAGSFIGEYLAGGIIAVFGLGEPGRPPVSNFPCTGMHGGKLYVRGACENIVFPKQVSARPAGDGDLEQISALAARYCGYFGGSAAEIMDSPFTVVTPDSRSPYKQMYVAD